MKSLILLNIYIDIYTLQLWYQLMAFIFPAVHFLTCIRVPVPISDKDNSSYSITIMGGWIYVPPDVNVFKIVIDLA